MTDQGVPRKNALSEAIIQNLLQFLFNVLTKQGLLATIWVRYVIGEFVSCREGFLLLFMLKIKLGLDCWPHRVWMLISMFGQLQKNVFFGQKIDKKKTIWRLIIAWVKSTFNKTNNFWSSKICFLINSRLRWARTCDFLGTLKIWSKIVSSFAESMVRIQMEYVEHALF